MKVSTIFNIKSGYVLFRSSHTDQNYFYFKSMVHFTTSYLELEALNGHFLPRDTTVFWIQTPPDQVLTSSVSLGMKHI